MNTQWDFSVLENIGKAEIAGRIICRIAPEDHKQIHLPRTDVGGKVLNRFILIYRIRVDRLGVENCLSDIAQSLINRVSESMHARRLMIAHDDNARSPIGKEILKQNPT